MAAKPTLIHLDNNNVFPTNCFPVKPLIKPSEEGEGAWLVAHKAEQRRHFKAVICTNRPKSYDTIKLERIRAERAQKGKEPFQKYDEEPLLDGFYLLRQNKVEDPSDICVINISGHGLSDVKSDDFALFDSVLRINAAENMLPLECLNGFPSLQELELPLNGLCNVKLSANDFPNLEFLDLSYNNLSVDDVFSIGLLQKLKQLHLSGNSLRKLPDDMAQPEIEKDGEVFARFNNIEVLMLDDNKLSEDAVFSSLAGLRKLKILNLERNLFCSVPFLKSVAGKVVSMSETTISTTSPSGRSSKRRLRSSSARESRHTSRKSTSRKDMDSRTSAAAADQPEMSPLTSARTSELDAKVETIQAKLLELNRPESVPLVEIDSNVEETLEQLLRGSPHQNAPHLPPPFQILRSINLAYNRIDNEEALIPVAAWPMLSELIIHDNPLTTRRSGNPPLLTRLLRDRLGINIIRKKPAFKPKPAIQVTSRGDIETKVPPVPRCNVDEMLLAIQAAQPAEDMIGDQPLSPLPPIPQLPPETKEPEKSPEPVEHDDADDVDSFFMTQVHEEYAETEKKTEPQIPERKHVSYSDTEMYSAPVNTETVKETKSKQPPPTEIPERYRGYEELLVDDDLEFQDDEFLPKDLTSNVRALEYMLKHPLTFNERKTKLEERQPNLKPKTKNPQPAPKPVRSRLQQIDDVLGEVKNNRTNVDAPLATILKSSELNQGLRKEEADSLLADIQRKYNIVRFTSMKVAKSETKESMEGMIDEIKDQIRKKLNDKGITS